MTQNRTMRFDVITLFPELFTPFVTSGVTRRAYESGAVEVRFWNPRDFAVGNYRRVDDRSFGGGTGMVKMAGVASWSASSGAVLVCGRYEGLDQRFIDTYVNQQISLGDFVLSGGEIAAMAMLDAVARLQPGVLNDEGSHQLDSFNPALDGLLDCPHYTRPENWRDMAVPSRLMSGDHADIERWRREQRLVLTQRHRPELVQRARLDGHLSVGDEAFLADLMDNPGKDA
jgi:tRNA (guanine37-N1)-methyltransferase